MRGDRFETRLTKQYYRWCRPAGFVLNWKLVKAVYCYAAANAAISASMSYLRLNGFL
jgi:hypothetical protein